LKVEQVLPLFLVGEITHIRALLFSALPLTENAGLQIPHGKNEA
jgi:hypothetical protein